MYAIISIYEENLMQVTSKYNLQPSEFYELVPFLIQNICGAKYLFSF